MTRPFLRIGSASRFDGASEKDVDMEEALASFIRLSSALAGDDQLPPDLAAAYFEQARSALADELPALLARFAAVLQDGVDPVTVLRRHLLPDPRWGPPSKVVLASWFNGGIKNADGDWAPARGGIAPPRRRFDLKHSCSYDSAYIHDKEDL
jgi:hypothetical protein